MKLLSVFLLLISHADSHLKVFHRLFDKYSFARFPPLTKNIIDYPKLEYNNLTEQDKYDLQWYVIGTPKDFATSVPTKATIWNKNYVVWKDTSGKYHALDDVCSHKGASLSGGYIKDKNIVCPYHGYEFDCEGELKKVPGICFQHSDVYNIPKYDIVEKNGWVYLKYMYLNIASMPVIMWFNAIRS